MKPRHALVRTEDNFGWALTASCARQRARSLTPAARIGLRVAIDSVTVSVLLLATHLALEATTPGEREKTVARAAIAELALDGLLVPVRFAKLEVLPPEEEMAWSETSDGRSVASFVPEQDGRAWHSALYRARQACRRA